jgi:glycosyltransferase involved in cell wall biosynthesis
VVRGTTRGVAGENATLRIAMLAPPWIPVPPRGYGGIESMLAVLADALVRRGHHVTLFAAPGSDSSAAVEPLLDAPHEDEIERSLHEVDHVARAFRAVDEARAAGSPFDLIHDNCGFTAFSMADRIDAPVVHTLHGPFNPEVYAFYAEHADKGWVVAISRYQLESGPPGLRTAGVVPNPMETAKWPLRIEKDDFLLWIGRMNDDKGPQRAIAAAHEANRPIVLAGPVQPGHEDFFASEVEPHLDGERARYIGPVGGRDKVDLFARASALLMPIRWPEPFGMVMAEAMVCGTPVIAFPEGSVPEVVEDGVGGFLVDNEHEMARAVDRLGEIDPRACRRSVEERFDAEPVAAAYEAAYLKAIREERPASTLA